jgi:hypothetical protein
MMLNRRMFSQDFGKITDEQAVEILRDRSKTYTFFYPIITVDKVWMNLGVVGLRVIVTFI